MNILFLMNVYSAFDLNGISTVTNTLIDGLWKKGHRIFIAAGRSTAQDAAHCSDKVTAVLYGNGYNFHKLRRFIEENSIDVIFNQGFFPHQTRYCNNPKINKDIRIFYNLHGMPGYEIAECESHLKTEPNPRKRLTRRILLALGLYGRHNVLKKYQKEYLKALDRPNSKIVLLTPEYIPQFIDCYHIDHNSEKITAIGNPVKRQVAETQPKPFAEKKNQVLFVGRMAFEKRVHIILKAWKTLRPNDWTLVLVGDGPQLDSLKTMANGLSNVEFAGEQGNVVPYYQESKIILLTSLFEGLPACLQEAASQAVVPLVYDISAGVRSIAAGAGVIVPQDDFNAFCAELQALMQDTHRLETLSGKALEKAKQYTPKGIVAQWENLLKEDV